MTIVEIVIELAVNKQNFHCILNLDYVKLYT